MKDLKSLKKILLLAAVITFLQAEQSIARSNYLNKNREIEFRNTKEGEPQSTSYDNLINSENFLVIHTEKKNGKFIINGKKSDFENPVYLLTSNNKFEKLKMLSDNGELDGGCGNMRVKTKTNSKTPNAIVFAPQNPQSFKNLPKSSHNYISVTGYGIKDIKWFPINPIGKNQKRKLDTDPITHITKLSPLDNCPASIKSKSQYSKKYRRLTQVCYNFIDPKQTMIVDKIYGYGENPEGSIKIAVFQNSLYQELLKLDPELRFTDEEFNEGKQGQSIDPIGILQINNEFWFIGEVTYVESNGYITIKFDPKSPDLSPSKPEFTTFRGC